MGQRTRLRPPGYVAAGRKAGGLTIGINELFEGIARVVERFAEELAEQRLQEKEQKTGRGPKVEPEKTEKNPPREAFFYSDFPKTG